MSKSVTFLDVVNEALMTALRWVHIALPARVKSYDATKGTAEVQICVSLPVRTFQDTVGYFKLPPIPDVPVAWPSGGGYFVAMSLAENDPVFLVFSDTAMGEYLEGGDVSNPQDTRRHSLGYPVAIPGGARPDPKKLADLPSDGLVIGKDGAEEQIKIDATTIKLGKTAIDFVALATKVDANFTSIMGALSVIVTAFNGTPVGNPVNAVVVPVPVTNPTPAAITKAK